MAQKTKTGITPYRATRLFDKSNLIKVKRGKRAINKQRAVLREREPKIRCELRVEKLEKKL